jgi:uncharacterized phiE125 gp8 family phage protein
MSLRVPVQLYQYQGSVILEGPAIEPVTLSEVKAQLRIDDDSEDGFIAGLINEAREEIEQASGLSLIRQKWRLTIDQWPGGRQDWWDGVREGHINTLYGPGSHADLKLPKYPLIEIDAVTVFDEDSNSQAVNVGNTFDVDTNQRPGRISLKVGATWPIALRANNAIQIDYYAGYGALAANVPGPLKRAIRSMVGYLYSHRGDGCDPVEAMQKSGAASVVNRYRTIRI